MDITNTNRLYYAYIINEEGFVINTIVFDIDDELDETVVKTFIPNGINKARWNGSEWVEGETADEKAEREAQQMLESLKPSPQELTDAELEIKMITMLTEMGVIQ
ncbi:hypothetical protein [Lysinibacillus sphaericus]|uniref:hypothetical protein n=1 Tax=Lysinibacillus sphaericus TaxID=1421 RepID=UPI003D7FDB50